MSSSTVHNIYTFYQRHKVTKFALKTGAAKDCGIREEPVGGQTRDSREAAICDHH